MNRESGRINFVNTTAHRPVRLTICPTTGGQYQLSVSPLESVVGIKCTLARKLRLHAERMSLLHKDRLLVHGNLLDNQVSDGSHLTLVPNMETGTANTRSNCRVMQALENLSETQVNDFLTGRAPLLLAMKLGEHMMFVQLQLSTSSCNTRRRMSHNGSPAHCSSTINSSATPREKPRCACNPASVSPVPGSTPGAIIDSVNHLGQGVYSGTFSGTLDPSMQDSTGRPKRDVNTILQILNDLLQASPQIQQSAGYVCKSRAEQAEYLQDNSKTVLGDTVNQTEYKSEDSLRGKVQSLQKMMQERKLRRQQKRGLRAPYQWTNRVSSSRQRMHTQVKFESPLAVEREVTSKAENHTASDATFSTASATAMEHESVLV